MGKHERGYSRVEKDLYSTRQRWVVTALGRHVDLRNRRAWECACGEGHMSASLTSCGCNVFSSDIVNRQSSLGIPVDQVIDFLTAQEPTNDRWGAYDLIITNPPLGPGGTLGEAFIEAGLRRIVGKKRTLCLLLPVDFDSAKGRIPYFDSCCPQFAMKVVLTKRIVWFERNDGKREAPKENHAWYVWRDGNQVEPVIKYAHRHGRACDG